MTINRLEIQSQHKITLSFTGNFVSAAQFHWEPKPLLISPSCWSQRSHNGSLSSTSSNLTMDKHYQDRSKLQSYWMRQDRPLQEHLLSGQAPTYAKLNTTSMEYLLQSHNSIYKNQTEVVKHEQQSKRSISVNGHISNKGQTKRYKVRGKQKEKETKGTKESR